MSWYDKDCPSDPHDAYREGERSRYLDRNPYEHGKYGEYECRRAYEEWDRGRDNAEREQRAEEAAQERAAERRAQERAHYRQQEEQEQYEAMEAEQMRYAEQDIMDAEAASSNAALDDQGSKK